MLTTLKVLCIILPRSYKHLERVMQRLSPNVAEAVGIYIERPNCWQRIPRTWRLAGIAVACVILAGIAAIVAIIVVIPQATAIHTILVAVMSGVINGVTDASACDRLCQSVNATLAKNDATKNVVCSMDKCLPSPQTNSTDYRLNLYYTMITGKPPSLVTVTSTIINNASAISKVTGGPVSISTVTDNSAVCNAQPAPCGMQCQADATSAAGYTCSCFAGYVLLADNSSCRQTAYYSLNFFNMSIDWTWKLQQPDSDVSINISTRLCLQVLPVVVTSLNLLMSSSMNFKCSVTFTVGARQAAMRLTLPDSGSPLPVSLEYAKAIQDALYNAYATNAIDSITDPDGASTNLNIVGLLWADSSSTTVQGNPCFGDDGNSVCSNICISSSASSYACDCFHGFAPVYQAGVSVNSLCRRQDACQSSPCIGGTCVRNRNLSYTCLCSQYTLYTNRLNCGLDYCAMYHNPCGRYPCLNPVSGAGNYTCQCASALPLYGSCFERLPPNGLTPTDPSWTFSAWYSCPATHQFIDRAFIYFQPYSTSRVDNAAVVGAGFRCITVGGSGATANITSILGSTAGLVPVTLACPLSAYMSGFMYHLNTSSTDNYGIDYLQLACRQITGVSVSPVPTSAVISTINTMTPSGSACSISSTLTPGVFTNMSLVCGMRTLGYMAPAGGPGDSVGIAGFEFLCCPV